MGRIETRLDELGVTLPAPIVPPGNFDPDHPRLRLRQRLRQDGLVAVTEQVVRATSGAEYMIFGSLGA